MSATVDPPPSSGVDCDVQSSAFELAKCIRRLIVSRVSVEWTRAQNGTNRSTAHCWADSLLRAGGAFEWAILHRPLRCIVGKRCRCRSYSCCVCWIWDLLSQVKLFPQKSPKNRRSSLAKALYPAKLAIGTLVWREDPWRTFNRG